MARSTDLLEPGFRESVSELLAKVKEKGFELIPFFTMRDVWSQARLWRQSRTTIQIDKALSMLHSAGAAFLCKVLEEVGPQYGRWATNALPGSSWHQWGEAVDCYVKEGGKAVWKPSHPGYIVYAKQAIMLNLQPGYYWPQRDGCHVQKRHEKVLAHLSWVEVEKEMLMRFGTEEES